MNARPGSKRRARRGDATHRGSARAALAAVVIALVAFLGGYGITALAFTTGTAPAGVALVPDLRELMVPEAARRTNDAGLELTLGDSLVNPTVPAGAILAQSPLPGQEVSPGSEVRVLLSSGPHRPTVPDVEAMPLALATRALQAAGFDVMIEEAPGEGAPGRVVSVQPQAGSPVPLPATVVLRIGAMAPYLEMPGVIGLEEEVARGLLEEMGLQVAESFYESTDEIAPYHVIGQIPAPGDTIDAGGAVRLRVALPGVIRSPGQ